MGVVKICEANSLYAPPPPADDKNCKECGSSTRADRAIIDMDFCGNLISLYNHHKQKPHLLNSQIA